MGWIFKKLVLWLVRKFGLEGAYATLGYMALESDALEEWLRGGKEFQASMEQWHGPGNWNEKAGEWIEAAKSKPPAPAVQAAKQEGFKKLAEWRISDPLPPEWQLGPDPGALPATPVLDRARERIAFRREFEEGDHVHLYHHDGDSPSNVHHHDGTVPEWDRLYGEADRLLAQEAAAWDDFENGDC